MAMSGDERQLWERLDDAIDALLAGSAGASADDADELLATARLVRVTPTEPLWPAGDYPARLATQLAGALRPASAPPALVTPNGVDPSAGVARSTAPHEPTVTRSWWRQAAQLAAALAAFGLVALVLVLVFRGSSGDTPSVAVAPSPPAAHEIAYASIDRDIYLVQSDGTSKRNVTNNPAADDEPAWSPDGSQLAFVSDRGGDPDIYVMNADGSNPHVLAKLPGTQSAPTWSPDGQSIAFIASTADGFLDIYKMDADGANVVRLTDDPALDTAPVWSPDSQYIAFGSDRANGESEIFVMRADGTQQHSVSPHERTWNDPDWSPDGQSIAYTAFRFEHQASGSSGGIGELHVVNADGTQPRNLSAGGIDGYHPRWSPDGRQLVYWNLTPPVAGGPSNVLEVFVMAVASGEARQLTHAAGNVTAAVWSPDGAWVAANTGPLDAAGNVSDRSEIRVVRADGSDEHVVASDAGMFTLPAWRPVAAPSSATPRSATPTPAIPALPTPDDSGIVRTTSFIEAQALVTFPLVMPDPLPDGVTFGGATVEFSPPGTTGTPGAAGWGVARDVTFNFNVTSADPNVRPPGIQLLQSTLHNEVAADEHTTVTQVTLGGKLVTKSLLKRDTGGDVLTYAWNTETVSYTVITVLRDGMTEELAAALVAATPLPDGATIEPPDATPDAGTGSGEQPFAVAETWDLKIGGLGAMTLGPDGRLYIVDNQAQSVGVYDAHGALAGEFAFNQLPDAPSSPGMAVAPDGSIWLLDTDRQRIFKLAPDGTLAGQWDGAFGREEGKLRGMSAIAVDVDGFVYIYESSAQGSGSILKFTPDGSSVGAWPIAPPTGIALAVAGDVLYALGSDHADGSVHVLRFDLNGAAVHSSLIVGQQSGYGFNPDALTADASGAIYLADTHAREVEQLNADGVRMARWDPEPTASSPDEPLQLVVSADGDRLFVALGGSKMVRVYATGEEQFPPPSDPPTLSLNPNSGTCTSQFSVIVTGFAPNSLVTVSVSPVNEGIFTDLITMPVDADGTVNLSRSGLNDLVGCVDGVVPADGTQFTVRAAPYDPKRTGDAPAGASASATFTYLGETPALLTVTPNVGACDTPEVASGVDFTPGTALAIYVNVIGGHEPALGANVTVANDGTFSVALDVTSIRACAPGFNPDEVYVVSAGPDAGKLGNRVPGRSAGTLFFAARDVPIAVAARERLPFCGADLEVARQYIDPTDAPLICLRDAAARGAAGEMATRAVTLDGETIKLFRASGGTVEVITATRATDELQYVWTSQTCASVEESVQPISVSGCSAVEQLRLAR
jgi:TolB protein